MSKNTKLQKKIKKNFKRRCGFLCFISYIVDKIAKKAIRNKIGSRQLVGVTKEQGSNTGYVLTACLFLFSMGYFPLVNAESQPDLRLYDINVPPLNAAKALNQLAEQTGATFLFPYDVAETRQANQVVGRYRVMDALDLLLEGSELSSGLSRKGAIGIFLSDSSQNNNEETSMKKNKLSIGFFAALASFFWGTEGIVAQENSESGVALEELVVVGYKASLAKAIESKRDAVGVRDSIIAEDIGKFPDLNLAESLQRITGVAISRDNGEGQQVSIRGLAPQFTQTTLNGMVISSSSIGGTNQASRGREFDFDLLPSELFSRVDVDKTSRADLDEGGIGGTVGLSLPRPFDSEGFNLSGSLQGNYSDLPAQTDPRAHFVVSNTWDNFGAAFQLAYSERSSQVEGSSSVDWTRTGAPSNGYDLLFTDGLPAGFTEEQLNNAFVPRLARTDHQASDRERLGLAATFQWQPNDDLDLTLDVVHAQLDIDTVRHNFDAVVRSQRGANALTVVPGGAFEIDSNNNLVRGTFAGVERRSENRTVKTETDLTQVVFNADWQATDNLQLKALVGTSSSEYDNPYTVTHLFQVLNSEVAFDYSGQLPSITTTTDLSNPANYVAASPRIRAENIQDDSSSVQFDFAYTAGDSIEFSGGLFFNSFEKDRLFLNNDGFNDPSDANIAVSEFSRVISGFDNIGAPAGFPTGYLVADFAAAESLFGSVARVPSGQVISGSSGSVEEDSSGFYVATDLNFDLGGAPANLNIGGRYIKTEQTSVGTVNGVDVSFENDYENFLPSINFNVSPAEDLVIRVSAAQAITRPSLGNLLPAISASGNDQSASGGNPFLQPFEADQFDFSAEWYFAEDALLSATFFYKDIKSFIVTETSTVPYSTLGLPLDILDQSAIDNGVNENSPFSFRRPVNGEGATLRGLELSYQQPLSFIYDGLGVLINYTKANSETQFASRNDGSTFANGSTVIDGTIPGLSENSYNLVVYYENETFGGRFAYNWRDEFIESGFVRDNTGFLRTRDAAGFLDASAFYNLNDNVTLTFEAINLLDEEEYTFNGDASRFNRFVQAGRQFSFGVRADF